MPQYSVNSEQLQSTVAQINQHSGNLMTELNGIIQKVQSTKDFWTGNASGNYERLMQSWKSTAERVRSALDETNEALKQAAQEYAETEQRQTGRFGA